MAEEGLPQQDNSGRAGSFQQERSRRSGAKVSVFAEGGLPQQSIATGGLVPERTAPPKRGQVYGSSGHRADCATHTRWPTAKVRLLMHGSNIVVFPHMIVPLFVGRKKSILALEEAMRSDTFILLATQKNASDDDPATEAIYEIGTLASVLQLLKLPDGTVKLLVEGAQRAKVAKYTDCSEYYEAEAVALGETVGERVEAKALARSVTNQTGALVEIRQKRFPFFRTGKEMRRRINKPTP